MSAATSHIKISCRSCPVGHAAGRLCPFGTRLYPKGHVLFAEGDAAETLWFVREGLVVLERDGEGHAPAARTVRSPGNLVGIEVLALPCYRNTAYAATPAKLCSLARDRAESWIADAAPAILRHLVRQCTEVTPCRRGTAVARTACWILDEARFDLLNDLSRNVIAELLSMTPETLSRALAQLAARGAIVVKRRKIEVKNLGALRAAAGRARRREELLT